MDRTRRFADLDLTHDYVTPSRCGLRKHVPLVAVDASAAGLAAVTHLWVLDRDPPVGGDTLADPRDPIGANDGVLVADLPESPAAADLYRRNVNLPRCQHPEPAP
jgi:hypothetical protein